MTAANDIPEKSAGRKPAELCVKYLPISKLLPYARNSRTHSDEQVAQIAASIREFGFTNPVLISKANDIIAGHGRVRAAAKLEMKRVPCIKLGHLTESQRRAYVIADNRLALNAGWDLASLAVELMDLRDDDFNIELLGFDNSEIDKLLDQKSEGRTDPDAIPENVETRCKTGDLWQLGAHRLLCGDSTDVLQVERLMGGEKADMVFTDPPYGVSYADKNAMLNAVGRGNLIQHPIENDHMNASEMEEFWTAALSSAAIACTNKATYYITAPQGELSLAVGNAIAGAGWQVKHILIWVKNCHVLGRCDYHYKHEPIFYGWKQGGTHEWFGDHGQMSVWDFPKPMKNDLHPTMKPVELVEKAIGNSTKNGGGVLDLFLGSGSTLIACEKTGRRCFGLEIDAQYCDVILSRWEKFTGKEAKRVE